jgi:hypothetical protein
MIYSHFNELHRFNQRVRTERIQNGLAKLFFVAFAVYIVMGVFA